MIDDLAATARQLWAEQSMLFTAGEVLRHGCDDAHILEWLVARLRVLKLAATAVLGWDGQELVVRGGDLPPGVAVGERFAITLELAEVLDTGEPMCLAAESCAPLWPPGEAGMCGPGLVVALRSDERLLGALLLQRPAGGPQFRAEEVKLTQLLADVASVAQTNRVLLRDAEQTAGMRRELEVAAELQRRLLPPVRERYGTLDVAAGFVPVAWIAGDGYFHRRLPGGVVAAAVFDITGHGLAAAFALADLTVRFDTLVGVMTSPGDLLGVLNDQVAKSGSGSQTLATAVVAFVDPATGEFQVASAGHPPALVVRAGRVDALEAGGLPLGVLPEVEYPCDVGMLEPGESLVLYSDGVSEAPGADGGYSSWERLRDVASRCDRGAVELLTELMVSTAAFSGAVPPNDDQTVLTLHRTGA